MCNKGEIRIVLPLARPLVSSSRVANSTSGVPENMAFRIGRGPSSVAETPEQFYNDLRTKKVQGLLAHQADVLRDYVARGLDALDVASELPTGSGKTLVGLVLAEWRRRKFGERVVYLCATNQLVRQVADQTTRKYGIPLRTFTGKAAEYDPRDRSAYTAAESIAVTSYASLFNTNPFFADADLLILDDAHAAESYVSGYWSLRIDRFDERLRPTFEAVLAVLRPVISAVNFARLTGAKDDPWSRTWVEMLPAPIVDQIAPALVATLDEHVAGTNLRYSWGVIRDHLSGCQVYYGAREILVRPLLPPTGSHEPFARARQRIYLSATLGEGGELERITGRQNIVRLPIPAGWDRGGTGRRLFMFPERSLPEAKTKQLVSELIHDAGRGLYLVPSGAHAAAIGDWADKAGLARYDARQLEEDKTAFVVARDVVAVLANRYDGIDLPDDECRLVIMDGLPKAVNLQEQFLVHRMGAVRVLENRIRTRVVQGFGRCTRSPTDYAAVVILGQDLNDYLLKRESRASLHPELRAEIDFGIDQSRDVDDSTFRENFAILIGQGEDWLAADQEIVNRRDALDVSQSVSTSELASAAQNEVKYQYAVWRGDHENALGHARAVLTELRAPELKGYRALWLYLAGVAAHRIATTLNPAFASEASSFFRQAAAAAPSIRWLAELGRTPGVPSVGTDKPSDAVAIDPPLAAVIERLEAELARLGTTNDRRYNEAEATIRKGLAAPEDSGVFEVAHERLGRFLGYDAGNMETRGAPDPWWLADESFGFVFEDYSEADPSAALAISKARQVMSHPAWMKGNLPLDAAATILPVLVSTVTRVEREALVYLGGVAYWSVAELQKWAEHALSVVRNLRQIFPGAGDPAWRDQAALVYREAGLDPTGLAVQLRGRPAEENLTPVG